MNLLAIDPGPELSAFVEYDGRFVRGHGIVCNDEMLYRVGEDVPGRQLVIEMVASYGMAVGREVFETVYWIGRFAERWIGIDSSRVAHRLVRRDVKMHLCGNNAAKDANIRAALLDKFGPGKERAVGKKASPGPLYGVKADEWAALALAVTFAETHFAAKRAA